MAESEIQAGPVKDRREKLLEVGLVLVIVWAPLAFLPPSSGSFVDIKLVALLAGTLAIWASRPPLNRRVAIAGAVWIGVVSLAAITGVDRLQSLAGQERLGGGLLLLAPCAYLVASSGGIPTSIRERIPGWITLTALAAAAVYLVARAVPDVYDLLFPAGNPLTVSSPLGHPIKLGAFVGVGIVASTAWKPKYPALRYGVVAVLASTLSLTTKRGGWVVALLGLGVVLLRDRERRVTALRVGAVVIVVLLALGFADFAVEKTGSSGTSLSGAERFANITTSDSGQARIKAFPSLARAWLDRPVLGWGPANTYGAYLSNEPLDPAEQGERGLIDAHDILLESLITTGAFGFACLLALLALTLLAWRGAPRSISWSAGIAVGLFAYHMVEPLSPSLTPLLFLTAGIATGRPEEETATNWARSAEAGRSPGRLAVGLGIGALTAVSLLALGSGMAEKYGTQYGSYPALSLAHDLAPWRLQPLKTQAGLYAVDSRDNNFADTAAAAKATAIAEQLVRDHPWDPSVRLFAAGIAGMTRDPEMTARWLQEQVERFPSEGARLPASVRETNSIEVPAET